MLKELLEILESKYSKLKFDFRSDVVYFSIGEYSLFDICILSSCRDNHPGIKYFELTYNHTYSIDLSDPDSVVNLERALQLCSKK